MTSWLKNIGLVAAGLLGGAMLTVGITAYAFMGDSKFPSEDLAAFSRVYGAIKRFYVEPVEDKKLVADAIQGMLSKLDPHSAYLDAKETKSFDEDIKGTFVGVGMQIDTEDGYIKVQSPIEGGPAERAGIKSGDLIVKIEEKSTKGMNTSEAVKLLRGEMATKVTITVNRRGDPLPMVITLTRETIKMANVRSKVLEGNVAYVRINGFIQDHTTQDFVTELNKVAEQMKTQNKNNEPPKHLILDLRNNGGGLLYNAVGVAAVFLPQDKLIVSIRGRITENNKQYSTKLSDYRFTDRATNTVIDPLKDAPTWAKNIPMTLLINQGSASASEIVAGAFKDYERAKILGTRSFGKGSVQQVIPLSDGASIKLTMQRYYTPKDISIQAKGIAPDYNVDETADGNPFAEFMAREGDNERALDNGAKPVIVTKTAEEKNKEAEDKLKRLEKLRAEGRRPAEFGNLEKDYQLQQAMNLIQGKPVATVKEEEKKDEKK
jgi:carboxyl-terminal processing protease